MTGVVSLLYSSMVGFGLVGCVTVLVGVSYTTIMALAPAKIAGRRESVLNIVKVCKLFIIFSVKGGLYMIGI